MIAGILKSPALDAGHRFHLRLVVPNDAALICDLRADPGLNQHLSPSSPNVDAQRKWIEAYKTREAEGREYYFVIVADGADRGVIRMYDFREIDGRKSFCWGSWIIKPPRPAGLVTYTLISFFELGFEILQFEQSHFDVRRDNHVARELYFRIGAMQTGADELNLYLRFGRAEFDALLAASARQIAIGRAPFPTP